MTFKEHNKRQELKVRLQMFRDVYLSKIFCFGLLPLIKVIPISGELAAMLKRVHDPLSWRADVMNRVRLIQLGQS